MRFCLPALLAACQSGPAQSEVSLDGLVWRFTLRGDAHFSDCMPISTHEFAAGWRRLNDFTTAAPHTALFAVIAGVNAGGDSIVPLFPASSPGVNRAAEEKAGHIRWLRPDYQIPRFAPKA